MHFIIVHDIIPVGSSITSSHNTGPLASDSAGARGQFDQAATNTITYDNEEVGYTIDDVTGLARIDGGRRQHVPQTIVVLVTDQRIIFLDGEASDPSQADAGDIDYADVAAVGIAEETVTVTTDASVQWEFPRPSPGGTLSPAEAHLQWLGEVRQRVVSTRNDVEQTTGLFEDLVERRKYQRIAQEYERARARLDEVILAVIEPSPIDPSTLAPELTAIERSLESGFAQAVLQQADMRLGEAQRFMEAENYELGRDALLDAHTCHERARQHAAAVERADAFQFGRQRELNDELERVGWEIEAVAAEPLRQAHEAKIRAEDAAGSAGALDHWETALRRFGHVLGLERVDEDELLAGDREQIRSELAAVGDQLIHVHRAVARETWNEGVRQYDADALEPAVKRCIEARDHLERAMELSTEFAPGLTDNLDAHLAGLDDHLEDLAPPPDRTDAAEPETGASEAAESEASLNEADPETVARAVAEATSNEWDRPETIQGFDAADTIPMDRDPSRETLEAAGAVKPKADDGAITSEADDGAITPEANDAAITPEVDDGAITPEVEDEAAAEGDWDEAVAQSDQATDGGSTPEENEAGWIFGK
jgi:hypothetical protein